MRGFRVITLVVIILATTSAVARAQASIAGQVRDPSGAVLPGVTVEASSPALIEKLRSVATGGTGQYRIELLPPGIYTITFALPGFSTVKREGIQLTGTFTATIDAELRVGEVQETVTVSGESPIVDIQSANKQRVIDRDLIDKLPAGRSPFAQMALIPGVTVNAANQDVGGATQLSGAITMQVHGSTGASQSLMENGLSTAALISPANSQITFNMAASQEIAVDYSGAGADTAGGGVRMNVIPREGGNTFNGVLFMNGTTEGLGSSNFTQRLKDAGLRTPNKIHNMFDVNPGFGGPLRRGRAWFYLSGRRATSSKWMADEFYDRNANNPNVWTYQADLSKPVSNDSDVNDGRLRLTVQAAPKVKVGLLYVQQTARNWPSILDTTGAPGGTLLAVEAGPNHYFPVERQVTGDVTVPLTNNMLIDGAVKTTFERAIRDPDRTVNPTMISVLEQSTGRQYRARQFFINRTSAVFYYRAAISYITGAHSFKFGAGDISGNTSERDWDVNPVSYRFNNGVPNQITMRAYPVQFVVDVDHQFGAFAQDRWTIKRLTVNAGLRLDWFKNSFPAQSVGRIRRQTFRSQEPVHPHEVRGQVRILGRVIHFRRKIIDAVVAETELGGKLLDRQQLNNRDPEIREVWDLIGDIEKRARFARKIWRRKDTDVQLVDHEIVKWRRNEPGLMPRKVGRTHNAIARERGRQFPRKRIALGARSAVTNDKKLVAIAVPHAGQKAAPMPGFVGGEQIVLVGHRAIDTGVDPMGARCPNPKGSP